MRIVGIFVGAALFIAVLGEGVYIFKQQRRLDELSAKLSSLQEESGARPSSDYARWAGSDDYPETGPGPAPRGERLPPPEFVPVLEALSAAAHEAGGLANIAASQDASLPLPPALSSPEARQQLRNFIHAQIHQLRQADEQQRAERRAETEERDRAALAERLGLSGRDAERFNAVTAEAQRRRRELMEQARRGELDRVQLRDQLRELYTSTSGELRGLLGEERFTQYQDLRGGPWARGRSGEGPPPRGP